MKKVYKIFVRTLSVIFFLLGTFSFLASIPLWGTSIFIYIFSLLIEASCILTIFNLRKNPPRYSLKLFNSLIALILLFIPASIIVHTFFIPELHKERTKLFDTAYCMMIIFPFIWLTLLVFTYRLLNWIAIKKVFYPAQPPAVPETSSS